MLLKVWAFFRVVMVHVEMHHSPTLGQVDVFSMYMAVRCLMGMGSFH